MLKAADFDCFIVDDLGVVIRRELQANHEINREELFQRVPAVYSWQKFLAALGEIIKEREVAA